MPQANKSVSEQLLTLEKLVKRVIRKSLKDNTLDYQIQFSIGNLEEPGKVKYAAMISSPAKGVQPITFMFDNYKDLEASLREAENGVNRKEVELTFHQSRINSYSSRIEQHKARMEKLNDPDYDEEEDNIEMEQMEAQEEQVKEASNEAKTNGNTTT